MKIQPTVSAQRPHRELGVDGFRKLKVGCIAVLVVPLPDLRHPPRLPRFPKAPGGPDECTMFLVVCRLLPSPVFVSCLLAAGLKPPVVFHPPVNTVSPVPQSHPEVNLLGRVAFVSDGTSNRLVLFSTFNLDELAVQGLTKLVCFVPSSGCIGKPSEIKK